MAHFTHGTLFERVENDLLHNFDLEQFHIDVLNYFMPLHIQRQVMSTHLLSRGQQENEDLAEFVRNIQLYYEIFRIEISELTTVTKIVEKFNMSSCVGLPLSVRLTTYFELDQLICKVKSVLLTDRITTCSSQGYFGLDDILDLSCANSRRSQQFSVPPSQHYHNIDRPLGHDNSMQSHWFNSTQHT